MNRILRPTLRKRTTRANFVVALTLMLSGSIFGQLSNCPSEIVNALTTTFPSCQANYSVSGVTTGGINPIEWYSSGATSNSPQPISSLEMGVPFNYGLTQITISDQSSTCSVALLVSENALIPTDYCADIMNVVLDENCMAEVTLPDPVALQNVECEPTVPHEIAFSWAMSTIEPTLILTHADLGTTSRTVWTQKYRSGSLYRTAYCEIEITVVDNTVPDLNCPDPETVAVAESCAFLYTYDVESASDIPCGGTLSQFSGDPSGTPLAAGEYTYSFALYDAANSTIDDCSWVVTVEETAEAATQMNCIAELNISIDENCEATIDASSLIVGNLCADLDLLEITAIIPGSEPLVGSIITFTEEHVGSEYEVSVSDPNGINSCWGLVTVEDKVAPVIICPQNFVIACTEPSDTSATGLPTLAGSMMMYNPVRSMFPPGTPLTLGNCDVELYFRDAVQNNGCEGLYQTEIFRTFYVIDASGNMSDPCTQIISITREDIDDASYPSHWDGIEVHNGISDNNVPSEEPLTCDGEGTVWNPLVREDGRVVPSPYPTLDSKGDVVLLGTGAPGDVGSCGTIFSFYEDLIIEICNEDGCEQSSPSFKVLRTWDVFDWCTGEFRLHEQIIKVLDITAPTFVETVPDITISTDLWGCGATLDLPAVSATDNCSNTISYSWFATGGTYDGLNNKLYFSDNALTTIGNEIEITAAAEDCCGNISYSTGLVTIVDLVPPVVVADEHTVVTLNNQEGDGSTKAHASTFDDGSFDGCSTIDYWVSRMDTPCQNYDGVDDEGKDDPTEIDEIDDFHKYVHFCCEDIGQEVMVQFTVCDDADGNGVPEMGTADNCNTAMVSVEVQDKLAPTIVCPKDATVNCIDYVVFEDYVNAELDDDAKEFLNAQFGVAYSNSTCGEVTAQEFEGEPFCGKGEATRTFTVTSSTGSTDCEQTIQILVADDNFLTCQDITFPDDSPEGVLFTKYIKDHKVYGDKDHPYYPNKIWCLMNPDNIFVGTDEGFDGENLPAIEVDDCTSVTITPPEVNIDNLCSEVGMNLSLDTFDFAEGGCKKILAHWEIIDQCKFIENYLHKPSSDVDSWVINPFVPENGYFEMYVEYDLFDTEAPSISASSVTVETSDCERNFDAYSASVSDNCTPDDVVAITFKVDIDSDGDYDYPEDGSFSEENSFDANLVDGLGIGEHKVKWVAYDGCGNYETHVQVITVVKRDKAPTPYCHLGISSAVMDSINGCSLETWALDFVAGGFDDCDTELTYTMIPYQDIYGDPADETDDLSVEDAFDASADSWILDCDYIEDGKAHVIEMRIYTIDLDGRYDFCDASLTLNDNFDCCEDLFGTSALISGQVATDEGIMLEDVRVNLMTSAPEFPRIQGTSSEGGFMFNSLPMELNYEISAENNENTKDGVTTLDLVLIQRHILGLSVLDSPYKIIASDINGSGSVSASDLIQLRKLILGLYVDDQLPNNKSWRFVDAKAAFIDADRPFPFDEMVNVNGLSHSMYNQNLVAVKIGDVNSTISANLRGEAKLRSSEIFNIAAGNVNYAADDKVELVFTSADVQSLYGMQLSLEFNDEQLRYSNVTEGALDINNDNVSIKNGVINLSWNDSSIRTISENEVIFTIVFDAKESGDLYNAVQISNQGLSAEAYDQNLDAGSIKLDFRTFEDASFVLYQNEPNPFKNNTTISFVLPEAGNATLQIFDVTGKVILSKTQSFASGINKVTLQEDEVNVSGVLYYQLTYGNNSATRKMILLD